MRTSNFNRSFLQPIQTNNTQAPSSDTAGPSTSTSAPREPMPKERKNYSLWIQGQITANFFKQKNFDTLKEQYAEVLNNITAFVRNELIDKLEETLLSDDIEKVRKENEAKVNKVEGYFGALQKHLFADEGNYFVAGQDADDRPFMYGTVKEMFHDFSHLLKDESILLEPRIAAVLAIASKERMNPRELESDLQKAIDKFEFIQQYTEVLDNITAFVRNEGDKLKPSLLESTRNDVEGHFHVLKKHLFEEDGKYFVVSQDADYRPLMYGNVKDMFHELAQVLQDKNISLQGRIDAVVALAPRAEVCSGGLGSDLQATIRKLKFRGLMGAAYKWKMNIMDDVARQHARRMHGDSEVADIHYVNTYYNLMAPDMGVEKRVDPYADNMANSGIITEGLLKSCKQDVLDMLKPVNLANELASQYRSRIEEVFKENKIDPNNVSFEEIQRLDTIQDIELKPEYGEVSPHTYLEQKDADDDNSPYVYTGKDWPTRFVLHFLKELKKEELVDYNDSKIVLADTAEGRLKMRDNLLWIKKKKEPHQKVTVQTWSKINPQELFDKIKEAEPKNVKLRAALVGVIVEHVRSLPQEEEARKVLGTWLIHATRNGQIGMLNALLKAGVDKEFKDNEGRTALMHAAANGQVGILQALINAGVSIEATDNQGRTALMHAAINGKAGTLKALLKKGAKKSVQDNEGKTAKRHAEEQSSRQEDGNAPALRVLKEAGRTSLSWKKKHDAAKEAGVTAMLSVDEVDLDELKALIEKGADIHAKNNEGYSPAMLAAKHGHAAALQILIENGADFEETHKGFTPLMLATEHRHVDALRVLIENGADIEAMYKPPSFLHLSGNKKVTNALLLAIKKADVDCMRVLLESGANTEVQNEKGLTPLMSVAAADDSHVQDHAGEMMEILIANGAHINSQQNIARFTPLMYAVIHTNVDAVRVLLENGADIRLRDHHGNTAHSMASQNVAPGSTNIWNRLERHRENEEALMRNRRNNLMPAQE